MADKFVRSVKSGNLKKAKRIIKASGIISYYCLRTVLEESPLVVKEIFDSLISSFEDKKLLRENLYLPRSIKHMPLGLIEYLFDKDYISSQDFESEIDGSTMSVIEYMLHIRADKDFRYMLEKSPSAIMKILTTKGIIYELFRDLHEYSLKLEEKTEPRLFNERMVASINNILQTIVEILERYPCYYKDCELIVPLLRQKELNHIYDMMENGGYVGKIGYILLQQSELKL